jgi:hypothetical protein
MKNNADMPAMPLFDSEAMPCPVRNPDTDEIFRAVGLTKREHFAGLAMQGILAARSSVGMLNREELDWIAVRSYLAADALLNKSNQPGE